MLVVLDYGARIPGPLGVVDVRSFHARHDVGRPVVADAMIASCPDLRITSFTAPRAVPPALPRRTTATAPEPR
jgi:hypothetical protein